MDRTSQAIALTTALETDTKTIIENKKQLTQNDYSQKTTLLVAALPRTVTIQYRACRERSPVLLTRLLSDKIICFLPLSFWSEPVLCILIVKILWFMAVDTSHVVRGRPGNSSSVLLCQSSRWRYCVVLFIPCVTKVLSFTQFLFSWPYSGWAESYRGEPSCRAAFNSVEGLEARFVIRPALSKH